MIVGSKQQSVNAFVQKLIDGSKLSSKIKLDPSGQSSHTVVGQFSGLCLHTLTDLVKEWVVPAEQDNADLILFLLGGECQPGLVGTVVQRFCDFFYLFGCLRADTAAVI